MRDPLVETAFTISYRLERSIKVFAAVPNKISLLGILLLTHEKLSPAMDVKAHVKCIVRNHLENSNTTTDSSVDSLCKLHAK